ncbi:hypothetical protein [Methylobacterium mesophilicum]
MPTRLERLEAALTGASAAVRRSNARVRRASADKLAEALAAPTPATRLAALEDPILTRADRRRLREHVGVSLAPASRGVAVRKLTGLSNRARILLALWHPNPVNLLIGVFVGGSIVTALSLAWAHTGKGARMSGLCQEQRFTLADGTTQQVYLFRGDRVTVRRQSSEVATIAIWAPTTGYATAVVDRRCLDTDR